MNTVALMTQESMEALRALREPFPPEHVGKLPRIVCGPCSKSSSRVCSDHKKLKCAECDNYITERHIHLDYVGHGAVSDRLLAVDPTWNWEPVAWDTDGFPAFICDRNLNPVAFWIRLTVGGVTRLGVGTCNPGQHDAEKVLIGDALRNAAMRFGVALDLWIKGHAEDDERSTANDTRTGSSRSGRDPLAGAEKAAPKALVTQVTNAYDDLDANERAEVDLFIKRERLPEPARLTVSQAQKVLDFILSDPADDVHPSAATGVGPSSSSPTPAPEGGEPEQPPGPGSPTPGAYTQMKTEAEHIADETPAVGP